MSDLTTVQKMNAIRQLAGDVSLRMRVDGTWYVCDEQIEIGGDDFLTSPTTSGATPDTAIESWWRQHVTDLPVDRYLVVRRQEVPRYWRWAGFMWQRTKSPSHPRNTIEP